MRAVGAQGTPPFASAAQSTATCARARAEQAADVHGLGVHGDVHVMRRQLAEAGDHARVPHMRGARSAPRNASALPQPFWHSTSSVSPPTACGASASARAAASESKALVATSTKSAAPAARARRPWSPSRSTPARRAPRRRGRCARGRAYAAPRPSRRARRSARGRRPREQRAREAEPDRPRPEHDHVHVLSPLASRE